MIAKRYVNPFVTAPTPNYWMLAKRNTGNFSPPSASNVKPVSGIGLPYSKSN
jgi:hypothetical protein